LWKKIFHLAQKRAGQHKENKGSTGESPAKIRSTIIRTSPANGWAEGIILLKKMTNCKSTTSSECLGTVSVSNIARASVSDGIQRNIKISEGAAKLTSTGVPVSKLFPSSNPPTGAIRKAFISSAC
jgi:hypothetical protein